MSENDKHWNDPKNWGEGLCGWYFCKEDTRLWVPKRIKGLGITVNLGHPKGGKTLIGIFLLPTLFLVLGLLASIAASIGYCGAH
jgi:uncharacterized membrane protein